MSDAVEPLTTVGFLHPGKMGVTLAAEVAGATIWSSENRSPATRRRAEQASLTDVESLEGLVAQSDVIVSICPPEAAVDVSISVARSGFDGIYLDANAVAPMTAARISELFERYVDGGVIGPPARTAGTTRLYLSGGEAESVAQLWAGSLVEARAIAGADRPFAASTLKMAYAGWTKGQAALLLAINALAETASVRQDLLEEWAISQPNLVTQSDMVAAGAVPKAWRFAGEMREISATMTANDLPGGFHEGAAELYTKLTSFKDVPDVTIESVLDELR